MPVAVWFRSPRIALIFLIAHSKERELAALHCPDTNMLEMRPEALAAQSGPG